MEQRLGRNTASKQAGTSQPRVLFDNGDFEAFVGGDKGGCVAARAAAQDGELCVLHVLSREEFDDGVHVDG